MSVIYCRRINNRMSEHSQRLFLISLFSFTGDMFSNDFIIVGVIMNTVTISNDILVTLLILIFVGCYSVIVIVNAVIIKYSILFPFCFSHN